MHAYMHVFLLTIVLTICSYHALNLSTMVNRKNIHIGKERQACKEAERQAHVQREADRQSGKIFIILSLR
jgi:hypothetical protein